MTKDQIIYSIKHLKQRVQGLKDCNNELKNQVKQNNQLAKDSKKMINKLEKQLQKLKDASIKAN